MNEFELDRDLAATNPVHEASVVAILPPDINESVVQQITESRRGAWRPRGINLARVGFVGVLASIGLILLGINFGPGSSVSEVTEITPAIRATPVEPPETTTTAVLTIAPATTLAVPVVSEESATSTPSDAAAVSGQETMGSDPGTDQDDSSKAEETPAVEKLGSEADAVETEDLPDDENTCLAIGDTRREAIDAYKINCDLPRVDCDPIGDHWVCSSEQLGTASP